MHSLEFLHSYYYSPDESITLPTVLRVGNKQVELAASVDTGASYCLFRAEVGEALGIAVRTGVRLQFRTANSRFEAFGHDVEISVLGVTTHSTVYFFADPMIDKNVLGRTG